MVIFKRRKIKHFTTLPSLVKKERKREKKSLKFFLPIQATVNQQLMNEGRWGAASEEEEKKHRHSPY